MSGKLFPPFAAARFLLAALYAVSSLVLGLAAVWGGSLIAEIL